MAKSSGKKPTWHRRYYEGFTSYEWGVWSIYHHHDGNGWEVMNNTDGSIWGPFDLLSNAKRYCVEQGENHV